MKNIFSVFLRSAAAMALLAVVVLAGCGRHVDGIITATTADGREVTVVAMNDNVVRVINFSPDQAPSITQASAIGNSRFDGSVTTADGKSVMTLPSGLKVTLDLKTGEVSFDASGVTLLTDKAVRSAAAGRSSIELAPAPGSTFYGAGERGHALALNGDTLPIYNKQNYSYEAGEERIKQMNISMPLVLSTKGYAIVFDDYSAAELILGDTIKYESETDYAISYYFVYGGPDGSLASVTRELTGLTGRQDMPPFWSLGYITSKYGYKTEDEARRVVDSLKSAGFPLDGIVLDLYWYGTETDMGRLEWDSIQWPNHRQMLADFNDMGVHTVLISQPYINKKGAIDNYNFLASQGLLTTDSLGGVHDVTTWVGDAGMFDVSNPATRQWLKERYASLTDEGVGGWWGDLGEPEVHPETIRHFNGQTARQYHNVYGNVWSSIIYDLYKERYPDTRLMTLMRGGTTGLQRYSVFPWTTDVSRSWGGLKPQVTLMLNSGLSGLGYMSHDVGGFAVDSLNARNPELYVRWLQLGLFSPVLRTHAQLLAEPYHYTDFSPAVLDIIKTRYNWLPYNYTLAYENASQGLPLVRPMNFRDPSSPLTAVTDQYFWGDNLIVAPVLEPGARSREVIVPPGEWVDYNNPTVSFCGPDTISYPAPLEVIPLLVRAGAFIPQAGYAMANTAGYDPSRYTVLYYPRHGAGASEYTLFEDDRASTRSLADNSYALICFNGSCDGDEVRISVKACGSYPGMPTERVLTFVLPGLRPADIKSLKVDTKPTAVSSSPEGWASVAVTLAGSPVDIAINL